jgi:glycosyltransferase involved in cell wall biosynthesis
MTTPLVSVWLITYNHELYIAEALESVLRQQTSFAVEIVIGEDCSTDGTRAIVEAYKARYPDRITLFLAEQNMGMVPILRPTHALCRGKYVAMLDGDDYWTDPLKLQKQVDQLERTPGARFNAHKVNILHASSNKLREAPEPRWTGRPGELRLEDFIRHGISVHTLSVVFRNDFGTLPAWYYDLPYPDAALLFMLLGQGGTAYYLPDNMGVYRVHRAGWFSSLTPQRRFAYGIDFLEKIREHLPTQYHNLLAHELQHTYYELLLLSLKKLELSSVARYMLRMSAFRATSTTHRAKRWPHRLLLSSLKHTGRILHGIRMGLRTAGN